MLKQLINYRFKQGIYLLQIQSHSYVGSSVDLNIRIRKHYSTAKSGHHENTHLQRCVNKYSIQQMTWTILEECPNLSLEELLIREKYWIDQIHPDLNMKLDPTTQQNCITTSIKVYQFDKCGSLIKEWPSISEAARHLHIHVSNIVVACKRPKRQKMAAGYYWSYNNKCPDFIKIIYIFDKNKQLIDKMGDTVDIYNKYFYNIPRKTVLSQLKKKILCNGCYKDYYFSYNSQI